jgi:hypothetical protein
MRYEFLAAAVSSSVISLEMISTLFWCVTALFAICNAMHSAHKHGQARDSSLAHFANRESQQSCCIQYGSMFKTIELLLVCL